MGRIIACRRQRRRIGFLTVAIETYGACNRACEYCFNHARFTPREVGVMKEETWRKIVDELAALSFCGRIIPVFYGEPLLDNRLPDLLAYARRRCPMACIWIDTNGDRLDEPLLVRLLNAGMDRLLITNHDREDKPHLRALVERFPSELLLQNSSEMVLVDRAGRIMDEHAESHAPCFRPSTDLQINWRGDVVLCCNDFYAECKLGNVNHQSLREIWGSPQALHYRTELALGHRERFPLCKGCGDPGSSEPF